jgi:hypothetical protein
MIELDKLKSEAEPYINTLVLDDTAKVVRLIGVDGRDDDYYWVFESSGGRIYLSSCVMGWTALKGVIPNEDYERLVRIWNLNLENQAI